MSSTPRKRVKLAVRADMPRMRRERHMSSIPRKLAKREEKVGKTAMAAAPQEARAAMIMKVPPPRRAVGPTSNTPRPAAKATRTRGVDPVQTLIPRVEARSSTPRPGIKATRTSSMKIGGPIVSWVTYLLALAVGLGLVGIA